jgi:hypothetical protein
MPEYAPLRRSLVGAESNYHAARPTDNFIKRQICLNAIATSSSTENIAWIFTDSQTSDGKGAGNPRDYQEAARARGSLFISVVLNCSKEENLRRIATPDRIETRGKLTDRTILKEIYKGEPIFRFGDEAHEIEIDVSKLAASKVAELIADHVQKVASEQHCVY